MVRRLISGVGRTLITTGVLLLLFVGYQLWGTGLKYDRLQDSAGKEFAAQLAAAGQPAIDTSSNDGGFGGLALRNSMVLPLVRALSCSHCPFLRQRSTRPR